MQNKILLSVILIAFINSGCNNSSINYISDDSGKYTISYFNYFDNEYTIFSYGKMTSVFLPKSYIKVKNEAFDNWECLVKWENDTAIFYQPYSQFESINTQNEKRLKICKMADTLFYRIYFDKSNKLYKKIESS